MARERVVLVGFATLLMLTHPILTALNAYCSESSIQEVALSAITDIIGLDTSKYSVTLSNVTSDADPSWIENFGPPAGTVREDIRVFLEKPGAKTTVSFRFINKTLVVFHISNPLWSAEYAKPLPANPIEATKIILQRFEAHNSISNVQPMSDVMSSVTDLGSVNATIGDVKREAIVHTVQTGLNMTSTSTSIGVRYCVNGIDSPRVMKMGFRDGSFESYTNNWFSYSIATDEINIEREEAINMARESAKNAANKALRFADHEVTVDLRMLARGSGSYSLYPFWFVELPLNYAGSSVTAWQVGIWADTSVIEYSHPTGVLGSLGDVSSTPSQSGSDQNVGYLVAPAGGIVIAVVVISLVAFKKRRK